MTSESVGTVAEEAAKLLAAVSDWASGERVTGRHGSQQAGAAYEAPSAEGPSPASGQRGRRQGGCEHHAHEQDEYQRDEADQSDEADECRLCPWCQLVRQVRSTSPEIRDLVASAATSLALAVRALLDNLEGTARGPGSGVEKINLTEDSWD